MKSSKQTASGTSRNTNSYENDIMLVDNYVAIFRCYSDMTFFVIGHSEDNELILGQALDCIHDCFDRIFRKGIERRALIENMSAVILVIDELIDQGIIMHLDPSTILARIDTHGKSRHGHGDNQLAGGDNPGAAQSSGSSGGGSLFASVFSSARSQLARSMGMN